MTNFRILLILSHVYIYKRENEKSILHRYATLSFQPLHSSGIPCYLLYIFCLPKKNKNGNTKVCLLIPLSKKPLHIGNSQPICIANQSTGSYTVRAPCKRNFRTNHSTYTKNKKQFSQYIVSFLFTLLNSAHKGSRNC